VACHVALRHEWAGLETLRGGAWNNDARNARVSYRNRNHPANYNDNAGFRVVVAPDLPLAGNAVALRSAAG
jgi:formylglycine-generating enzyme required for sulfatase activity